MAQSVAKKAVSSLVAKADQKKIVSDQKRGVHQEHGKLNDCCQFCNNRLVLEAVKRGDVHEVKKLLADYDNITNPYQASSFTNTDENALVLAAQSKNRELIKLFLKDLSSTKQRKRIESTLL